MTKTAYLFAGQGTQYLGMGRDLYDQYRSVRETFDEARATLGYDIRELIDTDEKRLHQTRYTQPAILTTSVAIWRLMQEKGARADMVAGLSLGEYSAMVASGALEFKEAVALVAKRGEYMEQAAPAGSGKMVAVLNGDLETIEGACQAASCCGIVAPANYNTPSQIVIGGEVAAVDEAVRLLREAGVKRLIPLNVSGPFHTALLRPASERLGKVLASISFRDFDLPLVGNTLAQVMTKEDIVPLLTRQVMEPVRFYDSIACLQQAGVTNFVEIGPGAVLSGFLKKIDRSASVKQVENLATLEMFVREE
ncbi:[acyl-carrier-protein] S-malonyltransferase [Streptococcus azizii]|uniref:Malonyl CoA-acyl carrier protein transacylase n=1 Tax=Streptococcus azizii TaxID=1579424 RepID=A0AB36JS74_9STRE|nr:MULTISPECIES: ACP S-malonyltransferase [Streptococcus]MBF0776262.1 ACP S-malonyltransferase [Streptococcus sp. 19428wD3_AN2]ONK28118.1 [acyl-carrier-protein] S-malonyltransferase [Streptococcus azizii]ONK30516.1 [acyl-carrier-protein] S-malonyltransferase [Streptococcus azizii]ONK31005.1 [acyl-carrier-protein] S-malonyltransferase [Streptococcus azizii]TFU83390.1 ACP S-malonyltransferase [Streptococcus sp. AN2]